jgi:T-complex protein 1 subunit theta
LEDIERAIDDAINVYRSILREPSFVPGAGSTETLLSIRLENEAKNVNGLDQYSYSRFAKAFEIIPRILAENAGLNSNEMIPKMVAANTHTPSGINIFTGVIEDIKTLDVYDHLKTK